MKWNEIEFVFLLLYVKLEAVQKNTPIEFQVPLAKRICIQKAKRICSITPFNLLLPYFSYFSYSPLLVRCYLNTV